MKVKDIFYKSETFAKASYRESSTGGYARRARTSRITDQEMRVAVMVKNDLTSQKIANMLYISLHTVKTHRKNIWKKLNIQNSTVNLAFYLKSKMVPDSM